MTDRAATTVTIQNRLGMHARPATMFVEAATKFDAVVRVRRCDNPDETVDGKSILEMMMLAATQGTELEIAATGDDAKSAVKHLVALVKTGFSED